MISIITHHAHGMHEEYFKNVAEFYKSHVCENFAPEVRVRIEAECNKVAIKRHSPIVIDHKDKHYTTETLFLAFIQAGVPLPAGQESTI